MLFHRHPKMFNCPPVRIKSQYWLMSNPHFLPQLMPPNRQPTVKQTRRNRSSTMGIINLLVSHILLKLFWILNFRNNRTSKSHENLSVEWVMRLAWSVPFVFWRALICLLIFSFRVSEASSIIQIQICAYVGGRCSRVPKGKLGNPWEVWRMMLLREKPSLLPSLYRFERCLGEAENQFL